MLREGGYRGWLAAARSECLRLAAMAGAHVAGVVRDSGQAQAQAQAQARSHRQDRESAAGSVQETGVSADPGEQDKRTEAKLSWTYDGQGGVEKVSNLDIEVLTQVRTAGVSDSVSVSVSAREWDLRADIVPFPLAPGSTSDDALRVLCMPLLCIAAGIPPGGYRSNPVRSADEWAFPEDLALFRTLSTISLKVQMTARIETEGEAPHEGKMSKQNESFVILGHIELLERNVVGGSVFAMRITNQTPFFLEFSHKVHLHLAAKCPFASAQQDVAGFAVNELHDFRKMVGLSLIFIPPNVRLTMLLGAPSQEAVSKNDLHAFRGCGGPSALLRSANSLAELWAQGMRAFACIVAQGGQGVTAHILCCERSSQRKATRNHVESTQTSETSSGSSCSPLGNSGMTWIDTMAMPFIDGAPVHCCSEEWADAVAELILLCLREADFSVIGLALNASETSSTTSDSEYAIPHARFSTSDSAGQYRRTCPLVFNNVFPNLKLPCPITNRRTSKSLERLGAEPNSELLFMALIDFEMGASANLHVLPLAAALQECAREIRHRLNVISTKDKNAEHIKVSGQLSHLAGSILARTMCSLP